MIAFSQVTKRYPASHEALKTVTARENLSKNVLELATKALD